MVVDLGGVRSALDALYESDDSPLGPDAEQVASPLAFAALLETALLCRLLANAHPHDPARESLAVEMETNVAVLHRGFGVTSESAVRSIGEAFDACRVAETIQDGFDGCTAALKGTPFADRVRPGRHFAASRLLVEPTVPSSSAPPEHEARGTGGARTHVD